MEKNRKSSLIKKNVTKFNQFLTIHLYQLLIKSQLRLFKKIQIFKPKCLTSKNPVCSLRCIFLNRNKLFFSIRNNIFIGQKSIF